jgi:hypothetical protein
MKHPTKLEPFVALLRCMRDSIKELWEASMSKHSASYTLNLSNGCICIRSGAEKRWTRWVMACLRVNRVFFILRSLFEILKQYSFCTVKRWCLMLTSMRYRTIYTLVRRTWFVMSSIRSICRPFRASASHPRHRIRAAGLAATHVCCLLAVINHFSQLRHLFSYVLYSLAATAKIYQCTIYIMWFAF